MFSVAEASRTRACRTAAEYEPDAGRQDTRRRLTGQRRPVDRAAVCPQRTEQHVGNSAELVVDLPGEAEDLAAPDGEGDRGQDSVSERPVGEPRYLLPNP